MFQKQNHAPYLKETLFARLGKNLSTDKKISHQNADGLSTCGD
jgi:hypothetical protein